MMMMIAESTAAVIELKLSLEKKKKSVRIMIQDKEQFNVTIKMAAEG